MNRNQLEAAIERNLGILNDARTQDEVLRTQLEQMKPDVWIPPDGMIVDIISYSGGWRTRVSAGTLDHEMLEYYCDGNNLGQKLTTSKWRRIPGLIQFTKHNGSVDCPCEDRPIKYKMSGAETSYGEQPENLNWTVITWWAYADDLVLGE